MPAVAASTCRYLTPPEIAKRYAVDPAKILTWIRSGQLTAIDVSTSGAGRPRYRISPSNLAAFEAARSAGPTPRVVRRRKRNPEIHEFF